ncbi:MAG: type II secretion system GspH family protein [Elusimicrobiota bacterium]|nr:type II secretion system GspH family protein [Elusimicrobiota bacterium]
MIKNQKGYTMLESLIAMLLVAIIAGGAFMAMISAGNAINQPVGRERVVYAVESVLDDLQFAAQFDNRTTPNAFSTEPAVRDVAGLGGGFANNAASTWLTNGTHDALPYNENRTTLCKDFGGTVDNLYYKVDDVYIGKLPLDWMTPPNGAVAKTLKLKRVFVNIRCLSEGEIGG